MNEEGRLSMKLCACGVCELEVTKEGNKFILGHNRRGKTKENDESVKRQAEYMRNGGAVHALSFQTEKVRERAAEKITGRTKENDEGRRRAAEKVSVKMKGNEKVKENLRKARKQIKNPSKQELKLRGIVKELFPISEHTYKVLENKDYEVDNALSKHKIVIEFDGWYHFDTEKHKEHHKKRQKEIEEDGWKFIRYTMFDKFPTKDQVKRDIQKVILGGNI